MEAYIASAIASAASVPRAPRSLDPSHMGTVESELRRESTRPVSNDILGESGISHAATEANKLAIPFNFNSPPMNEETLAKDMNTLVSISVASSDQVRWTLLAVFENRNGHTPNQIRFLDLEFCDPMYQMKCHMEVPRSKRSASSIVMKEVHKMRKNYRTISESTNPKTFMNRGDKN
ncbi:hypothetical protein KIN20_000215 [Parelaphostrongylus tenuis]|uniref:Uncharacterized protein n=1 Tax=Parelaphostrongylus tenuis TaxID=148309 RepID=A0AAD5LV37_PARTN|nr:hypothetical protein KIN20_000215 [Parelaphostrongylus tenuis]